MKMSKPRHLIFSCILASGLFCCPLDDRDGNPSPLSNVSVTAVSASVNTISISWTDPQTEFSVVHATCAGRPDADIPPGTETVSFDSLTVDTTYEIGIFCENSEGIVSETNTMLVSTTASGTVDHTPIATAVELIAAVAAAGGRDGDYFLTDDLNLSAYQTGTGWTPFGTNMDPFTGTLNGNGHHIFGLYINNGTADNLGFFGYAANAGISNVHIMNAVVTGGNYVGGLAGQAWSSRVVHCSVTGTVSSPADDIVGGLVGYNRGTISGCYSSGSVTGHNRVGGLVGFNYTGFTISHSYSSANVTGNESVGGLTGESSGEITACYASGSVEGAICSGGLVGINRGPVSDCYAAGNVRGDDATGGLLGGNSLPASIISRCYASGAVSAVSGSSTDTGAFTGSTFFNVISSSFTCISVNPSLPDSGTWGDETGVTGLTTAQMRDAANFNGWDFGNTWNISGSVNGGFPFLREMP